MITFDTSYGYNKYSLKIGLGEIIVEQKPILLQWSSILVLIIDAKNKEISRIVIPKCKKAKYGKNPDGKYFLNIYTKTPIMFHFMELFSTT